MGCDIHGFVEVKLYDFGEWYDCIDIRSIVGRNYDMFALLFGVRNYAAYIPIAPNRGLPELVSERAKKEFEEWDVDAHSPSWITWKEIQNINWHGQGTQVADRVFCYRPGEDTPYSSFGWSSTLSREDYEALARGETIEKMDYFTQSTMLCRREVQKTSDALSKDWECLFDLMRCLDAFHRAQDQANIIESRPMQAMAEDDCKVRLVVWFDN